MPRAPASDGLCRLSAYLEELEAVELKKFKLYLGTEAGASRIPWGRLEPAGPLDTAWLLVAHCGPDAAWPLALGLFQRINRRDLWERGQREEPLRGKEAAAAGALPLATVAAHETRVSLLPLALLALRSARGALALPSLPGKSLLRHQNPGGTTLCASSFLPPGLPLALSHPGWLLQRPDFSYCTCYPVRQSRRWQHGIHGAQGRALCL